MVNNDYTNKEDVAVKEAIGFNNCDNDDNNDNADKEDDNDDDLYSKVETTKKRKKGAMSKQTTLKKTMSKKTALKKTKSMATTKCSKKASTTITQ
jgi:hypothetical protein